MKNALVFLFLFIVFSIIISGCIQQLPANTVNGNPAVIENPNPIKATPANINFLNTATSGKINEPIQFSWRVVGGEKGKIEVTALHWDTIPKPVDFREYSQIGKSFTGNSPQEFSDSLTFTDSGTYFVRGHAIVDGKNIYTEEIEATISGIEIVDENTPDFPVDQNQFVQPVVRKYSITVDDSKFEPSQVSAKAGEIVELTITCAEQNVYFAGARVESDYFNTGAIAVGASKTVSFTMPNKDVIMTDYWPSTNVKKADGWIRLEK